MAEIDGLLKLMTEQGSSDLHLKVGQTFEYLFDYGDSWWHLIEVQHVGPVTSASSLDADE